MQYTNTYVSQANKAKTINQFQSAWAVTGRQMARSQGPKSLSDHSVNFNAYRVHIAVTTLDIIVEALYMNSIILVLK